MRWKSLYSFCRGLPVIHCFRFYVYLWQNCNLNAWQTYGCQWFVLARHHFLDYTRNWYRKQKQENEMDRCVLLGPNFPYFQCMRFYEIYLNEALSFQHCLHSRCFRWDENCFIALDVDFGLFIVSDFKFIYGKTAVSTLGKTYSCHWSVFARHRFLDYARNLYLTESETGNEMDRCVLLGSNIPYF